MKIADFEKKRFDKISTLTDDTLVMGIPYSEFKEILEKGFKNHFEELERMRKEWQQQISTSKEQMPAK